MSADDVLSLRRPESPFVGCREVFLGEESETWQVSELLKRAEAIRRAIPGDSGEVVGILSSSASFIIAGMLALWAEGLEPLILDPSLKQEHSSVSETYPQITVMADRSSSLLQKVRVVDSVADVALRPCWPANDRVAAKFLTSGSTGEPKIVNKRGYQLFRQLEQEISWLGCASKLKVMSMVPPFHILGNVYGFVLPMFDGGSTSYLHNTLPASWLSHIKNEKPDLVIGVPSHYRFLANIIDEPLPTALFISSGAPMSPQIADDFQRLAGHEICQIYGSTETGGVGKRFGFGPWQPFPGMTWRTRDEDSRLMVFSPWQERPGQWTVTDDLAKIGEDGSMTLLGRADSIVKVGGKRFSTNEIIQVIENSGFVDSAVAIAYDRFNENAIALFACGEGHKKELEGRLRAELGRQLAAFKVPRTIRVLQSLPLLSNGKIDRQALRALVENGIA